ncbi:hypothetical protein G7054_g7166 [Neopestalotiopsis clavispora]|nr:hypothetical protein G7054_g7166 [Neopestalotiopsis clavispora]
MSHASRDSPFKYSPTWQWNSGMSRHSASAHSRTLASEHYHPRSTVSVHSRPPSSVHARRPGSAHSRPPGSAHYSRPPSSINSHGRDGSVRGGSSAPGSHQEENIDEEAYRGEPNLEAQLRLSAELTANEPPVEVYDSVSQVGHPFRTSRNAQYTPSPSSMPPPPLPAVPPPEILQYSPASTRFSGSRGGNGIHHVPSHQDYPARRSSYGGRGGERRRSIGRAVNELSTGSSSRRMSNTQRRPPASRSERSGGGGETKKRKEKGARKTGIKVAGGEVVKLHNGKLALARKPKKSS